MYDFEKISNLKILYVEDDDVTRDVFLSIISKYVSNIYSACNGKEGLEVFEAINPNIIITDIEMPIMNGLDMMQNIKKINSKIIFIVLTAFEDDTHLAQDADFVLVKPVRRDKVLSILDSITKERLWL